MGPQLENETPVVSIAASTDTGLARKHNEDYVGYHVPTEPDMLQAYGALMVVCDGVGGAAAGEVAHQQAVHRILKDFYEAPREDAVEDRLLMAIEAANDVIYSRNMRSQSDREMGTTVVNSTRPGRPRGGGSRRRQQNLPRAQRPDHPAHEGPFLGG